MLTGGPPSSRGLPRGISRLGLVALAAFASLCCRSAPAPDGAHSPLVERPNSAGPDAKAAGQVGLGCGAVSVCADSCASDCPSDIRKLACLLGCTHDCRAQGCESARDQFDTLTDCIQKGCLFACMGGPSPDCRQCTGQECASEAQQCHAHSCTATSAPDDRRGASPAAVPSK